ncbi:MAG: hypothetical protein KBS76_00485 [Ruminococcus sp.]|nr:hypothetical protein [Candidatus Apopatosoma intestinale]
MENDFSEKLDAILNNPEMMAQLRRLADTMTSSPPSGATAPSAEPAASAVPVSSVPAPAVPASAPPDPREMLSLLGISGGGRIPAGTIAHSRALLLALKPYLDEKRCAKIDKALTMLKLAEMAGYFI